MTLYAGMLIALEKLDFHKVCGFLCTQVSPTLKNVRHSGIKDFLTMTSKDLF